MSNKLMSVGSRILTFGRENKPGILSGLAVAGLWSTLYATYKAAPVAKDILEQRRKDMEYVHPDDKAAKRAVVKETAWGMTKCMAPVVIGAGVTTACILESNRESAKRIATFSAAYAISDSAFRELNSKITEVLGERNREKVRDARAKDHLNRAESAGSQGNAEPIIVTGDGDVLCLDSYSGRIFRSNAQKIGEAINVLSADCATDMYVSLNDFYTELSLDRIPIGDDFGWNSDDLDRGRLPISISAQLTKTKEPCLCVEYDVSLRHDYRNLH